VRWQRYRILRIVRSRPRLLIAAAVTVAVAVLLPPGVTTRQATRLLIAWNAGAGLYVALATVMMARSSSHHICHRAKAQDDGQRVILLLAVIAGIASLAAIAGELATVKELHGVVRSEHVVLAGVTVLSSWAFIQVMFTLHYAHDYYAALGQGREPGLKFPDDEAPDYGDFFYFAAIIGTSAQTADVSFVSKPMRRIGSLHCILAYLFNTTVLALLINIAASML